MGRRTGFDGRTTGIKWACHPGHPSSFSIHFVFLSRDSVIKAIPDFGHPLFYTLINQSNSYTL